MERSALRRLILKSILYLLLLVACYVVQVTPGVLVWKSVHPMPVVAAVTAIAMMEGGFAGGVYGLLGGILCDMGAFHIFGIATIIFLILGCACGLCVLYLMQPAVRTAMLLSGSFAAIYGMIAHYLLYGMWGYEGAARLLVTVTLPSVAGTALHGAALFWLVRLIHIRLEAGQQDAAPREEGRWRR